MMLINYICTACGKETEILIGDQEEPTTEVVCEHCSEKAVKHNFKNNTQRWRYCD